MKKLSDDLRELANRVASVEKKVTAAERESKDEVQAFSLEAKTDAEAWEDAFRTQVKARQAASSQQWEDLETSYNRRSSRSESRLKPKSRLMGPWGRGVGPMRSQRMPGT
jgi:hypothetical protein